MARCGTSVRSSDDALVYLDEGPFDRILAELVIADIGVDGTIPRGLDRVRVERAILVAA